MHKSFYDLVSHGTDTEGQNECYGSWDGTTQIGWGPAFQYSCIHSDSNEYSGGNTVWYNYTMASAGTIIDENTTQENPASNISPATESVCPKGWTLPSRTEINAQRDNASFSPVLGGWYWIGSSYAKDTNAYWWSNETNFVGARRYILANNNNTLSTETGNRVGGFYIRCVVKKNTKTLSNLTYMQDMTPQTSFWTLVNGRSYNEV